MGVFFSIKELTKHATNCGSLRNLGLLVNVFKKKEAFVVHALKDSSKQAKGFLTRRLMCTPRLDAMITLL